MATLKYSLSATHTRSDIAKWYLTPAVGASVTVNDTMHSDTVTATQASPVTVALGAVTSPTYFLVDNADATNSVNVMDDAAVLAVVPAGGATLIPLEAGVTLKVQANVADCIINYAVFMAA
jgi:hypothetical protein